jgi:hypothetical protein
MGVISGSALLAERVTHADRTAREFALRKAEELEHHEGTRGRIGPEETRGALGRGPSDRRIPRSLRVGCERAVTLRRKGRESTPED